ncbi:MAG TPA: dTDP-4-dehydro-6-deoxyglucose aminotransferase [Elusimicrobia bacterium]|nr:dTDP-4-dehydro-6-deoxyglucose aminotransferase [Elusimicrobiota bacterium]HBT61922.1 dTDP-4-dehydro-6-deoxyglucose aminotransferase [Elusimicrobiota bacterium]
MRNAQKAISYFRPRAIDHRRFFGRVEEVLEARWFTNGGKMVRELEHEVARIHGVRHCVLVCNATIGLQLVLKALDLEGEIITTPFTFVATAHAIMWQRLIPVFCDIDPDRLTISPAHIEELVTPHTSAILGVHVFGQFCDVEAIGRIARKHRLKVIYDAAHSFMTSYKGTPVGHFGDAEVLSFHGTKLFHTFEGGAVLTDNAELAARLRLLKNFGFNGLDNVQYIGTNAKMNEVSAAYGLSLLPAMPRTIARLRRIHELYRAGLGAVAGIRLFELSREVRGNGQYLPVFVQRDFGISRDQLWARLWSRGVQTRRYFYPGAHLCEPYRSDMPWFKDLLPVARQVTETILCLPCYYDLSDQEVARVCQAVAEAGQDGARIKKWYKSLLRSSFGAPGMAPLVQALRRGPDS